MWLIMVITKVSLRSKLQVVFKIADFRVRLRRSDTPDRELPDEQYRVRWGSPISNYWYVF